ncbi:MAG TPA: protein phosphatase 2C domain-containing protein [Gammaproteobacteria bacterium]|nr:protein phosphatase 2C domain-containing protein [Gammaproteobacteria bacterium]
MALDFAKLSLLGNRQENQDRIELIAHPESALMICVDGMGGHSHGARAAELVVDTLGERFTGIARPVFDPQGFLIMALADAHDRVVDMGEKQHVDERPRATCAVCLVQDGTAYWAHVGDSRIYQIRGSNIVRRTRDHSHVEVLLREGLIDENEVKSHPMRNFVECCLGGDRALPDMSISGRIVLCDGDVLLACTDGFWSGLEDDDIVALGDAQRPLDQLLHRTSEQAVDTNSPHSDNTSALAMVWRPA